MTHGCEFRHLGSKSGHWRIYMRTPQRPRSKTINVEPHGDALAASLLASVSSLGHYGGARTLGYQKKKSSK